MGPASGGTVRILCCCSMLCLLKTTTAQVMHAPFRRPPPASPAQQWPLQQCARHLCHALQVQQGGTRTQMLSEKVQACILKG